MLDSTEKILKSELGKHIFTDTDLSTLFGRSAASRYGLVNKALKKGELLRLKRGLYMLAPEFQETRVSQYYVASQMFPHSYISLESALSYHGWIPERVTSLYSITQRGRNTQISNSVGLFFLIRIPIVPYQFLNRVNRELQGEKPFFMASPLRALCDLIYLRKPPKPNLDYLINSLRIDEEHFEELGLEEFEILESVYNSKRVIGFLKSLKKEIAEWKI